MEIHGSEKGSKDFLNFDLQIFRILDRTSSTSSLNTIRTYEEATKGWKKGEIALPYEFDAVDPSTSIRQLDPVHIIPLVDLGRLLVVLVTRSIELSNTQYSLLLENGGKLLNLGSEWIGARVQYKKRPVCFSEMLASDDFEYTDYWGINNDECEYFVNAFAVNDRIYIQSFVFDTAFELEMDFDHLEVRFNQFEENDKLHVTSNPYFAFHDDVFPVFVKNQVAQRQFSRHYADRTIIVPANYFSSLAFFNHISTVLVESAGVYSISFTLKREKKVSSKKKIIEFLFSNGNELLSVDLHPNGSVQYSSAFLKHKQIDVKNIHDGEIDFLIEINFEKSSLNFF